MKEFKKGFKSCSGFLREVQPEGGGFSMGSNSKLQRGRSTYRLLLVWGSWQLGSLGEAQGEYSGET